VIQLQWDHLICKFITYGFDQAQSKINKRFKNKYFKLLCTHSTAHLIQRMSVSPSLSSVVSKFLCDLVSLFLILQKPTSPKNKWYSTSKVKVNVLKFEARWKVACISRKSGSIIGKKNQAIAVPHWTLCTLSISKSPWNHIPTDTKGLL
jgi:hypothetical protein